MHTRLLFILTIVERKIQQHSWRSFKIKLNHNLKNPRLFRVNFDSPPFFSINFFNNLAKLNRHLAAKRTKKGGWLLSGRNSHRNVHRSELVSPPLRFSAANKLGCVTRPRFHLRHVFLKRPLSLPLSRNVTRVCAAREERSRRRTRRIRDATLLIIRADTFRITLNRNLYALHFLSFFIRG